MNLFFSDLDDTLFSSRRKHSDADELQPEAYLQTGEPICYSNHRQRRLRALMSDANALFIPVTARSVDAFHRSGVRGYHKAICANGAVIIDANGVHDQDWAGVVGDRLADAQQPLLDFEAECVTWATQNDLRIWLVTEEGLGHIYCVIKSNNHDASVLEAKAEELRTAPPDWVGTVHHNDNNLAIIPAGVSKTLAVAYMMATLQHTHPRCVTFGVGDSCSDWSFMSLCDFALMPTHSQLAESIGLHLPELETC